MTRGELSILTENRRGDHYVVDLDASTYVMLFFSGQNWTAVEMRRPFSPNGRTVIYPVNGGPEGEGNR